MLDAIFEDADLLVLSKPAGQTVNRAETTVNETTLQDELEKYLGIRKSEEGIGGRAGIVHRLDKETSGILVVAKTQEAFEKLQAQFKERAVDKEYLALVHGKTDLKGEISEPIDRHPRFRRRFAVVAGGRESTTSYRREEIIKNGEEICSFIKVHPLTGRTHQIRVHFSHIQHPVVSDPLYLSEKRLKADLEFCPRLFLHAASLTFTHPVSGARMRFEADLPDDLKKVLSFLKPLNHSS
ncbi:MAG TPA: RluA family pseudouridine synthase [Patescibacteria group bacterium]|nr:RluA family pseudouridine synthase [Patescibacteria group bacterium]